MEHFEITNITCHFCRELINGEVIKPCRCDHFFHRDCLQHLQNINEDPILLQKCETCSTTYNTRFKNSYDKYIYTYFTFLSKRLYYIYFTFGLLSTLISIIVDKCLDTVFLGMSLGCLSYCILIWTSITYANYHYNLLDNIIPPLILIITCGILLFNIYYTENWFDWVILALTSSLLTKSKKYLFILSSYYPYLIIENYQVTENNLV